MGVIEICFAIHDSSGKYCKYLGGAVLSLIERTDTKLRVHILHDDTLSENNKTRLIDTIKSKNNEVKFYNIDNKIFSNVSRGIGRLTVGTLFRLIIAEVLPQNVNKVIYLDADIVVNIDISELWDVSLEGNWIGGCKNKGLLDLPYPCKKGLVREDAYFNAGVLVFDLLQIRKHVDLLGEAIEYLENNPGSTFWDNDALNVIFVNRVKYLPEKFNCFTHAMRREACEYQEGIIHFAGDYVHTIEKTWFDKLFFEIWSRSAWWDLDEVLSFHNSREGVNNQRRAVNESLVRAMVENRKICLWGVNSVLKNKVLEKFGGSDKFCFYVDSNRNIEGEIIDGKKVVLPNILWEKSVGYFIIVLSKKYFGEIGKKLDNHGYKMNDDYIDGALLFSYENGGVFPGL